MTIFPEAEVVRGQRSIDAAMVRQLIEAAQPLADDELVRRARAHTAFVAGGGAGGEWAKLEASGLPLCVYRGHASGGEQLVLRLTRLRPGQRLHGDLRSADLSASGCSGVSFAGANLAGSVATDGLFDGADFSGCDLSGVDFSGSSLRGARLVGAELDGADFEHCDCTQADFTGATIERARFPGAILEGVIRRTPRPRPWLERFDAMVQTLRAHDEVEVYEVVKNPPARDVDLRHLEEAFGARLPPALRELYKKHDGVFLQWGLAGTPGGRSEPFGYVERMTPGCINLLPAAQVLTPEWEQDSSVNEVSDELLEAMGLEPLEGAQARAVILDRYAHDHHGDLIFGAPEPLVVVATDHGADLEASDFVDTELYLDVLLATWGTDRYSGALGIGWTRPGKRLRTWSRRLELDAVVRRLRSED